jgi:hypothetical protein
MSVCARCGATFTCAMADGDGSEPCWCASLPLVMPVPAPGASAAVPAPASDPSCWCPDCLRRHIAATGATPDKPA